MKKAPAFKEVAKGFAEALKAKDLDACMQYILPSYIQEQCMVLFAGDSEQFICDLLTGEDDSNYARPKNLVDIKNVCYENIDSGFAEHILHIELKDGRSYIYGISFDSVEIYEFTKDGPGKNMILRTQYITGKAVG
ncbi:MAG: hypothetical protein P1P64_03710 [Treponemataceae bacterium]